MESNVIVLLKKNNNRSVCDMNVTQKSIPFVGVSPFAPRTEMSGFANTSLTNQKLKFTTIKTND
jgi:hypothetical protein